MARRGRPPANKEPKRKAVKVRLCPREHTGKVTEPYRIMESIIARERTDLADVKVGIAWHKGWRPDADGVRTHGKVMKRTDLDRSLDGYDAMIILNEESWTAFGDDDKVRLLTHELEHLQIAADKNGEPLIDDKGRVVIRIKRHDVADFASIIQRFGLPRCLSDVEIKDGDRPLLKLAEEKEGQAVEEFATTLRFRPEGIRNAGVTVDLERNGDQWRAGFAWQLGNYSGVAPISRADWYGEYTFCLQNLLTDVSIALAGMEITGKAEQRRAVAARRDKLVEQVTDWLQARIDVAPTEDEPRATGHHDACGDQAA